MFTQNYGQNWCFAGQFDLKKSKNSDYFNRILAENLKKVYICIDKNLKKV